MKHVALMVALSIASACSVRTTAGIVVGGSVGTLSGVIIADDKGQGALIGAVTGSLVGLVIGALADHVEKVLNAPDP